MAERVYPTTKPPTTTVPPPTTAAVNASKPPPPPSFPATKSQLYNASRPPAYRPQQQQQRQNHHRPPRRSRRCCCCLCFILILLLIIIIAAIAGAVVYFLYSPHTPDFSIKSFTISQFNLTSSSSLHTKFNITVDSSNPNDKFKLLYNPISISVASSSHNIPLGTTTIPAFISAAKNTTTLRSRIATNDELDAESTTNLKSDMKKNKNGIKLEVEMNTKVKVQIGKKQSYKIPIRIRCDGIKAGVPVGKTPVTAKFTDKKCKVELMIKIWKWKWTF